MTTRILYAAALTAILAFTSCDKKEAADPEREHAHALYKELRSVYAAYADSLEHMATAHTDSTRQTDESVSKLVERFEQRLKHGIRQISCRSGHTPYRIRKRLSLGNSTPVYRTTQ